MLLTERDNRDSHYWSRLLTVGLAWGIILAYAGYIALVVVSLIRPAPSNPCCLTPADLGFRYEDVAFTAGESLHLRGWYIPSQNGAAVILLHGYGKNRSEMLDRARMLANDGFGVLLYDLRGHGQSGGDVRILGWPDILDVRAAVDFLKAREDVAPGRIGILGRATGAQIALRAAAWTDDLQAVVADGPVVATTADEPDPPTIGDEFIQYGNDLIYRGVEWRTHSPAPPGVAALITDIAPRPVLFIAAGPVLGREARITAHFHGLAGEPKEIWTVPDAKPGLIPETNPEDYQKRIVSFFSDHLLQ
jgi:pimeloyl-ACP methyl ester carboxylesterase